MFVFTFLSEMQLSASSPIAVKPPTPTAVSLPCWSGGDRERMLELPAKETSENRVPILSFWPSVLTGGSHRDCVDRYLVLGGEAISFPCCCCVGAGTELASTRELLFSCWEPLPSQFSFFQILEEGVVRWVVVKRVLHFLFLTVRSPRGGEWPQRWPLLQRNVEFWCLFASALSPSGNSALWEKSKLTFRFISRCWLLCVCHSAQDLLPVFLSCSVLGEASFSGLFCCGSWFSCFRLVLTNERLWEDIAE